MRLVQTETQQHISVILTPSNKMIRCSSASPVCVGPMSNNKCLLRPHRQGSRQRPLSTVPITNVTPCSQQRRWSFGASSGITVTKNKKEPEPPQRSVSLLRTCSSFHPPSKRYSCPPIGIHSSQRNSLSSSSSSSCSSPPPVQTSVITGPDPLGWKLHPISRSNSSQRRTNRLSLQIPLPAIPTLSSPDPSPKTKPPLRPKPFRRRHSDSSTFRRSLPVVTLEELCNVHLRTIRVSDEVDDVFSEGIQQLEKEKKVKKIPPPVPEKTAMARQFAQLITQSRQRNPPPTNKHSSMMKPKHPNGNIARLKVDMSCDRQRSTPHFPG